MSLAPFILLVGEEAYCGQGVAIIYFTLHALTFFLKEKCGLKGFETGKYGSPPSISYWARQLAVYLFSLTIMKLMVLALFAATPGIFKAGEWLLSFLGSSDTAQVILYGPFNHVSRSIRADELVSV